MSRPAPMTAFELLAEPVRLYLIELLCCGATTSGDLATMCFSTFRIGWSSVSRHLARLEESGFVRRIDDAAERWVALEPDWLERAGADLDRLRELWCATAESRRLGIAGELYDRPLRGVDDRRPIPRVSAMRGRRGRAAVDRADFGVGRSHDSRGADGGGAFE